MNRTCEKYAFFENLYMIGPGGPCYTCECNSNFVPKEEDDSVSHPNHYQSKSGLEVIDAIRAFTEDCEGIEAYYTGNVIKYICRWKKKNGLEDLKKARQYLDWLIEFEDQEYVREDRKRELNRIFGAKMFNDFKEPPKNERYSMDEVSDCFVPRSLYPKIVSTYEYGNSYIEKQIVIETIRNQFCDTFFKALKEVSEEKKEKKDEK